MTAPVPPIHEVKGRNPFCGPAAYAALTGRSTDQASRAIREITGKPNVMGLHRSHLRSHCNGPACRRPPQRCRTSGPRWRH